MSQAIMMRPAEVAKVHTELAKKDSKIHALSKKLASKAAVNAGIEVAETVGGAAVMGFIRGKFEDKATGKFVIPGTEVDIELAAGLGLVGLSFAEYLGKYNQDGMNVGLGVLAHYLGQVGRKYAETGTFSLSIAGSSHPMHRRHVLGSIP